MELRRAKATNEDNNHSKIDLGLNVYTKLSEPLISKYQRENNETSSDMTGNFMDAVNIPIQYKLTYAGKETVWCEKNAQRLYKSQ